MNSYSGNNTNFYNQNFNMNNNINHTNKINFNNLNMNSGNINTNFLNNQTMNILVQYMNMMNFNINRNNNNFNHPINNNIFNCKNNINTFNNQINNNAMNLFPFMPNLINYGFNLPYTFDNVKKSTKKQATNFNKINPNYNQCFYSSNHLQKNYNEDKDDFHFEENSEKKFMRKTTKAERIEIDKWVEARKKLYPTQKNIELKNKLGELKVEKGLMSNLELKLRKKVNILKKISSSNNSLKRKREKINNINQFKTKFNKENENKEKNIDEEKEEKINKDKDENNLEDGEINEEKKNNDNGEIIKNESDSTNKNRKFLLGKKRGIQRKKNKIKKNFSKNKNGDIDEDNKEINFKRGFKYKANHLYDELIKKDKIKEQNIILQAIRYLINIKNDE